VQWVSPTGRDVDFVASKTGFSDEVESNGCCMCRA